MRGFESSWLEFPRYVCVQLQFKIFKKQKENIKSWTSCDFDETTSWISWTTSVLKRRAIMTQKGTKSTWTELHTNFDKWSHHVTNQTCQILSHFTICHQFSYLPFRRQKVWPFLTPVTTINHTHKFVPHNSLINNPLGYNSRMHTLYCTRC